MQLNTNSGFHNKGLAGYGGLNSELEGHGADMMMDKFGNMCKRPPAQDPHRDWASPVVVYNTGATPNGCNDSDRLLMAEWDKHNVLCRKHFGNEAQVWGGRSPEKIEAFLQDYFDNPKLMLVQIQKMYNRSNGFPVWHFEYQI